MLSLARVHEEFVGWARRRGLARATLQNYRIAARTFARFLAQVGIDDLAAITPALVAEFQAFLVRVDSVRGAPYASGTRIGVLSWMRRFFGFLHVEGHLLTDPTARMRLPKKVRKLPRAILTADEMRRLIWAPDVTTIWGLRDRAILELLYGVGLRYAELANLSVSDLDLEEKTLWVRQGKGRKDRLLPLGRWATYWLAQYLQASEVLRREDGTDRLFLTPRRRRLANWVLARILRRYALKAGIEKPITPHALRHTFATLMLRGGADVRRLQRLLGHEQISSTEVYTHLNLDDLRDVQKRCHPREQGRLVKPTDPDRASGH